jgi:predicted  nucleic acid-binding Zn-ribbon protein
MILKSVRNEDDAKTFVALVYSIQEVQQRSGLSLEALDNKVHELERKTADLEPTLTRVKDCKKELAELSRQQEGLASAVALLEQKEELLSPWVKDLEDREQTLSRRIADVKPKAQKAETNLSALRVEMQRLKDAGFSLKELAEFNEKLQVIAQHHAIKPAEFRGRLLHDLETLDKGLALETLIQSRQQDLDKTEQALIRTKGEIETLKAVVDTLKQEKTNLEASIKETREKVSREITKIVPFAHDTIDKLREELQRGNDEALAEVRRLRDEAMEVGKEVGRCEGILQANAWLSDLSAFVRGEENIPGKRVKIIVLPIVRSFDIWLKGQHSYNLSQMSLTLTVERLVRELEAWET